MRALFIHAAKDLRLEEADIAAPGPNEVEVTIERGGICGSDLHYFHHGGFGTVRLRQKMILGHEIAGRITALGPGVSPSRLNERVAVNPSRPCGTCLYCQAGMQNHCEDMEFFGSAMRFPHVHGGFREKLVVHEQRAVGVPPTVKADAAAMAEPLAVCLHAARRAGDLMGRDVLILGCGPIGALMVLVARQAGAARIVVTDVVDQPLAVAATLGATRTINVITDSGALDSYGVHKGRFDVVFEASGNGKALAQALPTLRPRGVIVQIGMTGEVALPLDVITAKEIDLRGTFRFHQEFDAAATLIGSGRIDLSPLLTASRPLSEAREAFLLASDRARSMKVQLAFA